MRIGSLFSGAGMLDEGVRSVLGGSVAWHAEVDPGACKVLAHRYPDVPNLGDVTGVDWAQVEPVDVITGGYPCQPFSMAGKRAGTDDARHLWPYVADALAVLRPRMTVFENVRGHLSLGFDVVTRDLSLLGYDCQWTVLRAADVGAPHNRARIFIIGKDRHERRLRGGAGRRRGMDRDLSRQGGGHVCDQGADCDGHEGLADPGADARPVRRSAVQPPTGDGAERAEGRVGRRWVCCLILPDSDQTVPCVEGGSGGLLPGSLASDRAEPEGTRSSALERRPSSSCSPLDAASSGGQRAGAGQAGADAAEGSDAVRSVSVGRVVGADRRPVWACAVRREVADDRADDFRALLRAADVGAPHGRFRVFVVATDRAGARCSEGQDSGAGSRDASARAWGRQPERDDRERGSLADAQRVGRDGRPQAPQRSAVGRAVLAGGCADTAPDADEQGRQGTEPAGRRDLSARGATADAYAARDGREPRHPAGDARRLQPVVGSDTNWGQYEPAIRRWESVVGPAPAPTELGAKGGQRLSPRFTEWMIGWPVGWVTHVPGLTRDEALKICGNGVVPQQAAEALRRMLASSLRASA